MEIVYNGYDNVISVEISMLVNGVTQLVDFSAATSVTLVLPGIPQTISTGIDWSKGNGVLDFDFGGQSLPKGVHEARLVAVDSLHPNGQVLIHEGSKKLTLKVLA